MIVRQLEEVARPVHVVVQEDEDPISDAIPQAVRAVDEMLGPHEERHILQLEVEIMQPQIGEGAQDSRHFEEAVMKHDQMEIVVEMGHLEHVLPLHPGDHFRLHIQQDHPFVQDVVMAQAVDQGMRHIDGVGNHENGGAGHADGAIGLDGLQKFAEGAATFAPRRQKPGAAAVPGHHDEEERGCDQDREPSALEELQGVGGEKGEIHDQEDAEEGDRVERVPVLFLHHHKVAEHGVDGHGARDGDAIGVGQRVR